MDGPALSLIYKFSMKLAAARGAPPSYFITFMRREYYPHHHFRSVQRVIKAENR